jgi:glycerol-3-phosphate dehydrogenase
LSQDIKLAEEIAGVLSSDTMTVEASNDVTGVEICGALKNVLAIAIGIVRGSEMGDNSMAALLTYVTTLPFPSKMAVSLS